MLDSRNACALRPFIWQAQIQWPQLLNNRTNILSQGTVLRSTRAAQWRWRFHCNWDAVCAETDTSCNDHKLQSEWKAGKLELSVRQLNTKTLVQLAQIRQKAGLLTWAQNPVWIWCILEFWSLLLYILSWHKVGNTVLHVWVLDIWSVWKLNIWLHTPRPPPYMVWSLNSESWHIKTMSPDLWPQP